MRSSGFTFIELLIGLAIIAVLAAFALPSFTALWQQNEATVLQQQLLRTLQFAQQEARVRHAAISVCKSNDGATCGGEWQHGQIVFLDNDDDGVIRSRDQILEVRQSSKQHAQLHWRGFPVYRDYVQFSPAMTNDDNGTFWYCASTQTKPAWAIVLNKAGRARVVMPDKNGDIADTTGKVLGCVRS